MTGLTTATLVQSELDDRQRQLAVLQAQAVSTLDSVIAPNGDIAYVEFPLNSNVGNHLMWLATMNYLESRGRRVAYVAHHHNYSHEDLHRAIGSGPILITGGVGASGLWPAIREVRHRVIAENPDNPIVLLPQTVSFRDQAEREASQDVLGSHPDLTVLLRDVASYQEAVASYPTARVLLCPDLAFLLPPQRRRRQADHLIVWLARHDIEGAELVPPGDVHPFDWVEASRLEWPAAYVLMRASGVISRIRKRFKNRSVQAVANALLVRTYRRISRLMLDYGNQVADRGEVFVTDRLHAHLLAVLRGQQTVVLPDKFGKNRSIYDAWSSRFECVHWADSVRDALRLDVLAGVRPQS